MKRSMKIAALVLTGGMVLQLSSCGTILVQLLAQNVLSSALRSALDGLLGSSTG